MLFNVSQPYQIFNASSMSGTATVTCSAMNLLYLNDVSVQVQWTGSPIGNFFVQGSIDYNPGFPQSKGAANLGVWNTINLSPAPQATGSGNSILINMDGLAFPYLRVQYTNSSGQGALTGYICGKAEG